MFKQPHFPSNLMFAALTILAGTAAGQDQANDEPGQAQSVQTLFQELDIQRAPKFAILGVVTGQELRYQLLSELRVGKADEKGFRPVEQTVKETRLTAA